MSTQLTTVNQTQLQNWAAIIQDCKASGLKVNEYCEQNNISRDAYYYWFHKVKKEFYSQNSFVEIPSATAVASQCISNHHEIFEIRMGKLSILVPTTTSKENLAKIIEVACHAE